jgi:hypothetical protein
MGRRQRRRRQQEVVRAGRKARPAARAHRRGASVAWTALVALLAAAFLLARLGLHPRGGRLSARGPRGGNMRAR